MDSARPTFATGKIASSSSSAPFFIVPAVPTAASNAASGKGAARSVTFASTPKPPPIVVDPATLVSYRAPAHKHAHHLHSIPPREKTAKTLIIDHMLWQHTRARFHQARSELGLPPAPTPAPAPLSASTSSPRNTSSEGSAHSPSSEGNSGSGDRLSRSPNQRSANSGSELEDDADTDAAGMRRPAYEELSELDQDVRALKFGVRGLDRLKVIMENAQDRFADTVDLDTAFVQRASAEGMEKVISSMLTQAVHDDHECTSKADGKACVCHNVRMRIELSALVNDFFARDHSITHRSHGDDCSESEDESEADEVNPEYQWSPRNESPMSISSLVSGRRPGSPPISTLPRNRSQSAPPPDPTLPATLQPLVSVSSYAPPPKLAAAAPDATRPAASSFSSSTSSSVPSGGKEPRRSLAPPNSIFSVVPRGAGPESPWALGPGNGMGWPARVPVPLSGGGNGNSSSSAWGPRDDGAGVGGPASGSQAPRVWKAIGRSRDLFNGGVSRGRSRARQQAAGKSDANAYDGPSSGNGGVGKEASSGAGGAGPIAVGKTACPRHLRDTDSCPATCVHKVSSGSLPTRGSTTTIGAGLSLAGPPLRRPKSDDIKSGLKSRVRSDSFTAASNTTTRHGRTTSSGKPSTSMPPPPTRAPKHANGAGHGESRMADVLPRFLRFSALIAKELGREAREAGEQRVVDVTSLSSSASSSAPSPAASAHSPLMTNARRMSTSSITSSTSTSAPPAARQQEDANTPSSTGHARPSRAWYAILCGIVTRAVLEGYIRAKWKGADPLEVLFGLGLGTWIQQAAEEEREKSRAGSTSRSRSTSSSQSRDAATSFSSGSAFSGSGRYRSLSTSGRSDTDVEMRDELTTTAGDESDAYFDSSSGGEYSSSSSSSSDDEDAGPSPWGNLHASSFEPDGMPSLEEAVKILFGRGVLPPAPVERHTSSRRTSFASASSGHSGFGNRYDMPPPSPTRHYISHGGASPWSSPMVRPGVGESDPDWEWETSERISEFATISLGSPDLLTHLQDLSRRYPPEPVERGALRFFESVAEWRGVPELESYKARRAQQQQGAEAGRSSDSSAAASRLALLGYFTVPKEMHRLLPSMPPTPMMSSGRKRGAEDSSSPVRNTKSARSEMSVMFEGVEPGWTGPYGI